MHSFTSSSFLNRRAVGQLVARLAALFVLYILLRSDGSLLSLVDNYGAAGHTLQFEQWVIQSAIFYGFGYWLFPRFLYRFRPFPLPGIALVTYLVVYVANYAGFVWLHQTVGFPAGYKTDSDMAAQWQGMAQNGPLGLLVSPRYVC